MTKPNPDIPLSPLRSEFANDPEMVELVEAFLAELPQRVASVERAFRAGQADELKRLSHQLRGAAGGYGFPTVGDAAAVVEVGLRNASDPSAALRGMTTQVQELLDLCYRAATSSTTIRMPRPTL